MGNTKLKTCKNFYNIKRAVDYLRGNGVKVSTEQDARDVADVVARVNKINNQDEVCNEVENENCNQCRKVYEKVAHHAYMNEDCGLNYGD
jgi:hypothetical protein